MRLGIGDEPGFQSRLKSVSRQLANQELLDRLIYGDSASFSEDSLRAYVASHADEFTIAESHLKLRLVTFRGRDAARKFAVTASSPAKWTAILDSEKKTTAEQTFSPEARPRSIGISSTC